MKIRQDYVDNSVAIQIVVNYYTRIMHPLLLQAYHHLNPNRTPTKLLSIKDFFWAYCITCWWNFINLEEWIATIFKVINVIKKKKIASLAGCPCNTISTCLFLKCGELLVQQLKLNIWLVSLVITNLWQSRLGIKNLDCFIFIIKNSFDNVEVGCDGNMKLKYMLDFVAYVATMIGELHKFIEEKGIFEEDNYEFD